MYKILALDGGGIRSIFTAQILFRLHDSHKILNRFDMVAGTSGGAILAAGLGCGWSASQLVDLFAENGPKIFDKDSFCDDVDDLLNLSSARYGERTKLEVFRKYFGNKKLSDLRKTIVIPAFDVKHESGRWQPVSFTNYPRSKFKDAALVDAVMASSAAPTYFPVYKGTIAGVASAWIDGGIWANNPSMTALSEALREDHGRVAFKDVAILNIGTTCSPQRLKSAGTNLGIYPWLRNGILDIMLDGGSRDAVDYHLKNILGVRYKKVDMETREEIKLDDSAKIKDLIDYANGLDLSDVQSWLEGFWV